MDIKIRSVDWKVLENALEQAKEGRLHILDRMEAETKAELGGAPSVRAPISLTLRRDWRPSGSNPTVFATSSAPAAA